MRKTGIQPGTRHNTTKKVATKQLINKSDETLNYSNEENCPHEEENQTIRTKMKRW